MNESGATTAAEGDEIPGVDVDRVTEWFAEHVPEATAPLSFELIAGGRSNLTFSVTDALGRRWVLRRPPLGQVLATAHDMEREFRIISALQNTDVPVAPAAGLCTDDRVNGAPFYVMEFVDGHIVRSMEDADALDESQRRTASESVVDVLARIHAVDVDAVGLGDLGRKENYIARQLKRWYGQFQQSDGQVDGGLGIPVVHEVHTLLSESIPDQGPAAIVHGDYRLDNCMLAEDGSIAAVLDWEICTLGDPLADLGLLCVYWSDPDEAAVMPQAAPTALPGFARTTELVQRYADVSGRDVSDLPFYMAFGYWKLTCIIAGVYARYAGGAMGTSSEQEVVGFRYMLDQLADMTAEASKEIR